jgi:transcriptional regulator with XRE-family HTH domain
MGKLDASAASLGRKIAFHRTRRGLSQRDFGALVHRSETWVSQVERGERRIDRMTVLRKVAEALGVPLSELAADTPILAGASSRPAPASTLRMLLSSSLLLALAITPPRATTPVTELQQQADRAWQLAHAAAYDELIPLLTDLLVQAEGTVRQTRGVAGRPAYRVLARAYHAAAAALVKLGELAAAWVAADRAITAAERAGDRLLMGEGVFRLVLVFQAGRQYDQAERAALTGIEALAPLAGAGTDAAISLQGSLHLQLAVLAGRQNRAEEALDQLSRARNAARRLGEDRNDYNTEFGPTNVAICEVGVAVELGDAGTALRTAAAVDASRLSAERQGRLLLDVARAHAQRRNLDSAVAALLDAERITPEQTRSHWITRNLLQDLDHAAGGRNRQVRELMERSRILTQ